MKNQLEEFFNSKPQEEFKWIPEPVKALLQKEFHVWLNANWESLEDKPSMRTVIDKMAVLNQTIGTINNLPRITGQKTPPLIVVAQDKLEKLIEQL